MFCPSLIALVVEKANETLPVPSAVTDLEPRRFLPGAEFRVPLTVVVPVPPFLAEERTGLFCRLLGPVSVSPGSLAVGPSAPRSMPSRPLAKTELESMRLPLAPSSETARRSHRCGK
jgi:hypothetical protein